MDKILCKKCGREHYEGEGVEYDGVFHCAKCGNILSKSTASATVKSVSSNYIKGNASNLISTPTDIGHILRVNLISCEGKVKKFIFSARG